MPWEEFTIDNDQSTIEPGRRREKAFIIIYSSIDLTFRITARFHDGGFKYYIEEGTGKRIKITEL